jgi:hypothetical protein
MATYEEFLAAIGTTGEFAPFDERRLPLNLPGLLPATRPPRQMQHEVYDEIVRQMVEHVQSAIKKYPGDIWLPFEIIARAEKIVASYVDGQFDELVPFRDRMRKVLHTRWRMERRRFIRIALMRPDPSYEETFKGPVFNENRWGQPGDIAEDFRR